ncbi:MAG TPA: L-histidine N(alpha)-methyltransferase [Methyloceanibacter sp.]|nr:L-histidine N(alpha)-methyltransferase [Methyloceanibacter sp.]
MERDIPHTIIEDLDRSSSRPSPRSDPARADFAHAVLAGLARKPRSLPCRFFYDARGSELFEEITQLPEYYPTRAETALLEAHSAEIAECMGDARVLVEFGSGSSRKTSLLLSALHRVSVYVPIDVAGESLAEAADWLSERHDGLAIKPLVADFTKTRTLPVIARRPQKLGFFSGSTIGNLTHAEARSFLANAARLLGRGASFLIGVDLKKDPAILIPAYKDKRGVTAAFNLNLLERINRELEGDIDLDRFAHDAIYNEAQGRIEMHLVSLARQTVRVLSQAFSFATGERIHTENSHKYSVAEFQALASASGWTPAHAWTDQDRLFSLHLLRLA